MPDSPDAKLLVLRRAAECCEKAAVYIGKAVTRFGRILLPGIKTVIPSFILGVLVFIVLFLTGLGDVIGKDLAFRIGSIPALLVILLICFIPAISPVLGPGLPIAVAAGVFTGEQIASGSATPFLILPALMAIDAQIGNSFIPAGFVLEENQPETIGVGVPGTIFNRLITIPAAVALVCFFTFVL